MTQTSDTPLVDHYTAADEVATLTPLTDAVRFRLHASFCDWPEEAQEAIELYDELARTLERENARLRAALDEIADEVADEVDITDKGGPNLAMRILTLARAALGAT
jgi:hypothetical protein